MVRPGARCGGSEARRIAADVEAERPTAFGALGLAALHAELGELDAAFSWLNRQPAHAFMPWARNDPVFQALRGDARFDGWLRQLELPPLPP